MESEEESSARIIDNKFTAYVWLNFKLAKEGAGNSSSNYVNESRRHCSLLTAYRNNTNGNATKQQEGVFPFTSKDQITKARSLGITLCVLARHKI